MYKHSTKTAFGGRVGTHTIETKEEGLSVRECFAKIKKDIESISAGKQRIYLTAVVTMRHFCGTEQQLQLQSKAEEYVDDFENFFSRAVTKIESKMEKHAGEWILKKIDLIKFNYISH